MSTLQLTVCTQSDKYLEGAKVGGGIAMTLGLEILLEQGARLGAVSETVGHIKGLQRDKEKNKITVTTVTQKVLYLK